MEIESTHWHIVDKHGRALGGKIFPTAEKAWEHFLGENGYSRASMVKMGFMARQLVEDED